MTTPGLYIHVPFCVQKCPYCDFFSIDDLSLKDAYVDALIGEMAVREGTVGKVDTIYIGGGTPTVLSPEDVGRILEAAHRCFPIQRDAEITIEANPGTIAAHSLSGYRAAGVNRINIGVQSFDEGNLRFLGRIHTARASAEALQTAASAGFERIGLDLIYGLPHQNKGSWRKDLIAATAFAPAHIACYTLTYEHGTPLKATLARGDFAPLPEDRVSAMFLQASKFLTSRGYEHYEISNYAASQTARSRHNQKYWQNAPYVGLGTAAHSYVPPVRSWNHRSVGQYLTDIAAGRLPIAEEERLDERQMMIEAVYLGLRQADGIDIPVFEERFDVNFQEMFGDAVKAFAASGHMDRRGRICRLTVQGMLFLDSIAGRMIERI